jgi:NAD(P)-dependent dehydrogenase (short-subunit alcohol dehydrogenase family)
MYAAIFKQYGTIDILCANAGIQMDAPFVEMTLDQWNRVLAVNLTGQSLCAGEATREFIRRDVSPAVSGRGRQDHLHEFGASGDSVGSSRQLCCQQRRDSHADADYRAGIGTHTRSA